MAVGSRGAVAAEHGLASAAGVEILDAGGNAVDAAVAASLATGVVNPSSSGLGGGGFMVVYLTRDGRAHTIDYREAAPGAAARDMFVNDGKVDTQASKSGGLAVGVPGEPAGLALALERFGTMSMAEVAAPAIRLARDGFVIEAHLGRTIGRFHAHLAADPALSAEFLHADGRHARTGELLKRPALADTLDTLARDGADPFYKGEISADIVATVRGAGGIMKATDLAAYAPVQRPPVVTKYNRWSIIGMSPPSSGGGVIGQTLGVLDAYRMIDLGHNSATYLHLIGETFKAVFADRAQYYGDPDLVDVPLGRLLSYGHASDIRRRLRATRVVPAADYGNTAGAIDGGTSHISVVDEHGNAAACTTSVNTAFGAKLGVPGRGLVLNNTIDDFSLQPGVPNAYGLVGSEANSIAAGKRPLSSMSPTLVVEDGRIRLAVGASGGPLIITGTLQTLINTLEFSMDVERAVRAPRIHNQWMPDVLAVEDRVRETVRDSLTRLGHELMPLGRGAAVQAVEVVDVEGQRRVRAFSDARKGGVARAQ